MTARKGAAQVSPHMERLAAYIAAALRRPLPAPVAEKTRHHVLDTIAAMVSGSRLMPGRKAIAYVKSLGGTPEATRGRLARRDQRGQRRACERHARARRRNRRFALAVSDAPRLRDRVRPHSRWPSAHRRNGTALLRAVALGYDVAARLSFALGGVAFHGTGHTTHCVRSDFRGRCGGRGARAASHPRRCGTRFRMPRSRPRAYRATRGTRITSRKPSISAACPRATASRRPPWWPRDALASRTCSPGERNFFVAFDESRRIGKAPEPAAARARSRHDLRDHEHQHQALVGRLARYRRRSTCCSS